MIWTNFAPAVVSIERVSGSVQKSGIRRGQLSCVWIETGNPRQPLARIWIDDELPVALEEVEEEPQPYRLCARMHSRSSQPCGARSGWHFSQTEIKDN
jgi:hypothetical protein